MVASPLPVLEQREDGVLWITLNRPERMNTVTPELYELLGSIVVRAAADRDIRCVVLTGEGRAFCAGRDLKSTFSGAPSSAGDWLERRTDYLLTHVQISRLLHEMPKPTIAMVNGACAGAGLSLAGACDMRIVSSTAVFTSAFAKVGLPGDMGGVWFWSRILGAAKARRLYLTSERFDAPAAEAFGLVDQVVSPDMLHQVVADRAREFAAGSARAYRYIKAALNAAEDGTLEQILEMEAMATAMAGVDAATAAGEIALGPSS